MKHILIISIFFLFVTVPLSAQSDIRFAINGKLEGKKVVFTTGNARMDAGSAPFYELEVKFKTQVVKTGYFEDYDYFNFDFRVSRRQYLNKLPWPQTFTKFIYCARTNKKDFWGGSIYYRDKEKSRDINMIIERIETTTTGIKVLIGTIDYKQDDDNYLKGAFRLPMYN